jgi:hypothetical protein
LDWKSRRRPYRKLEPRSELRLQPASPPLEQLLPAEQPEGPQHSQPPLARKSQAPEASQVLPAEAQPPALPRLPEARPPALAAPLPLSSA